MITVAAYTGAFQHRFVDWDDPVYVEENPLVLEHRYGPLLTTVVSSNYHPLTMISLGWNAGQPLSPRPFLVTNVLLHAANTALVFWLVLLLSDRKVFVAAFAALLFGIHPMHVESVAWVSERKDVLYTFFFMAGLVTYWRYLRKRALPWLGATFLLFVLSCLAKGMAVVFPLVLLLLDYWRRRPLLEGRTLLEKIPFFAVALLFGLIAMNVQAGGTFHGLFTIAQNTPTGVDVHRSSTLLERVAFPAFGHMMYLWKLLVPTGLSAFYPYPHASESSRPVYWVAPLVLIATVALAVGSRRRARGLAFGLGWYLLTIAPVLQWIPVGAAIMADRYTYIPYIGLGVTLALGAGSLAEARRGASAIAVWSACALFAAFLFGRTTQQIGTWKDSEALWSNVIHVFPGNDMAYVARGNSRGRAGRVAEAMGDLQTAVRLGSQRADLYDGLGNAYASLGRPDSGLVMFTRALSLDPNMGRTYYNRAIAYLRLSRPTEALADLSKALELMPLQAPTIYFPRGNAYLQLGRLREAAADYDRALAAGMIQPDVYCNRGICRAALGDRAGAAADFREALRLDPGNAAARAQLRALGP